MIIDDEPLRKLRQAVAGRVNWVKRRGAQVGSLARALGLTLPHPSVTMVRVEESRPGSKRYEKVSLTDAVARSIMRRYGIEEVFSHDGNRRRGLR